MGKNKTKKKQVFRTREALAMNDDDYDQEQLVLDILSIYSRPSTIGDDLIPSLIKQLRDKHPVYRKQFPEVAAFKDAVEEAILIAKTREHLIVEQKKENKQLAAKTVASLQGNATFVGANSNSASKATNKTSANGDAVTAKASAASSSSSSSNSSNNNNDSSKDDDASKRGTKRTREEVHKIVREKLNEQLKTKNKAFATVDRPSLRYSDVGGIETILQDIRELIEYPFRHPEIFAHLGVEPPRGILLCGPPGSGKTMLASAIAGELGVPFFSLSAPEIIMGTSGDSEAKIRQLFKDAVETAPAIIFIDEIDAVTPKREAASKDMEKRIVAQLLSCMDELTFEKTGGKMVLVLGATNRQDFLDTALRRAGRFDREITLGIPDEKARAKILEVMSTKMKLTGDFEFPKIAKMTPGFVGADLLALTKEAAAVAINRIFQELLGKNGDEMFVDGEAGEEAEDPIDLDNDESLVAEASPAKTMRITGAPKPIVNEQAVLDAKKQKTIESTKQQTLTREEQEQIKLEQRMRVSEALKNMTDPLTEKELEALSITMEDFVFAVSKVQPSSKREGFATIPDVTWEDIGALQGIREELQMAIMKPIKHPEYYEHMGLSAPAGVLLFGPPGCGKTLLAKAIANSSGANFISIKGPELLNKFVGESERAVRQVFTRARSSSPCVIFFDELDALCPKRGNDSSNQATERVVNQLLTEMDGLDSRRNVFVIAATNRPDIIDPAMLRPGRLDKLLYVALPVASERSLILKTISKKTPIDKSINLETIAKDKRCENFSGADLTSLVREAAIACLKENEGKALDTMIVSMKHFNIAFAKVAPSVTAKDRKMYDKLAASLRQARSHLEPDEQQQQQQQDGTAKQPAGNNVVVA